MIQSITRVLDDPNPLVKYYQEIMQYFNFVKDSKEHELLASLLHEEDDGLDAGIELIKTIDHNCAFGFNYKSESVQNFYLQSKDFSMRFDVTDNNEQVNTVKKGYSISSTRSCTFRAMLEILMKQVALQG